MKKEPMPKKINTNPKDKMPKIINEKGNVPSMGSEVDQNYLKSFYPKPTSTMKWVYTMFINIQGLNLQAELTMEVVEIKGDDVKIKTVMGNQSFDSTVNINAFAPIPNNADGKKDSTGFRFETNETITVPAGTFETVRLAADSKSSGSFLWLSNGIGPVKFGISHSGVPATLELKEFIQ